MNINILTAQAATTAPWLAGTKWIARVLQQRWRLLQQFSNYRNRSLAKAQLQSLSDHQLKDIGIARCEIEFAVKNGRQDSKAALISAAQRMATRKIFQ